MKATPVLAQPSAAAVSVRGRRAGSALVGVTVGLGVWFVISAAVEARGFPSPEGVVTALGETLTGAEFYDALAVTGRRILIAWFLSFGLGVVWGLVAARSRVTDGLLRPWMLVGLALPSPVAVLFAILLLGLSETSAILGLVLVTAPFVANIVYENTVAVPAGLIEMGRAYRFGRRTELQEILLPYLVPALLASGRLALQLTWKEVLLMEALARPDGIGERLSFYYQVLRPDMLVAYTVVFAVGLVVIELAVFRPLSRHQSQWRGKAR